MTWVQAAPSLLLPTGQKSSSGREWGQHPSLTGTLSVVILLCSGEACFQLVRPGSKARPVTVGTGVEHARLELIQPLSFAFWARWFVVC